MKKFAVVSDLHFDTHKPKNVNKVMTQLIDMLDANEAEYILMAGDLSTSGVIPKMDLWRELMRPIADRTIFTPGNHDFYSSTFEEFWERIHEIGFAHVLNNNTITVNGVSIYGGTLWFDKPHRDFPGWCDFEWIKGSNRKELIYQSSAEFKCNMPKQVDIVMSHHIPTMRSLHPKFIGEPYNCFFINECDELIRRVKPQYWVNGHGHDAWHYQYNEHTKIICNPLGYPSNDTGRYGIKFIEVK